MPVNQNPDEEQSFELLYLSEGPVPWEVLYDHLMGQAVIRKGVITQRIENLFVMLNFIPDTLRHFASSETGSVGPQHLILPGDGDPDLNAEIRNGQDVIITGKDATWFICWPGEDAPRLAEMLRGLQSAQDHPRLSAMLEFVRRRSGPRRILISIATDPMAIKITPKAFYESIYRTVHSVFSEDIRWRKLEAEPPGVPKWSDEEKRLREYYRKDLQDAFDKYADRFGLARVQIVAEGEG